MQLSWRIIEKHITFLNKKMIDFFRQNDKISSNIISLARGAERLRRRGNSAGPSLLEPDNAGVRKQQ